MKCYVGNTITLSSIRTVMKRVTGNKLFIHYSNKSLLIVDLLTAEINYYTKHVVPKP